MILYAKTILKLIKHWTLIKKISNNIIELKHLLKKR